MTDQPQSINPYLRGSLPVLYAKTALPIIFVMSMNGLLTVVDAMFLGIFVGPVALGAVTVVFPFFMLLVALSTLVSSGMASVLARYLGAGDIAQSRAAFAGAHGLSLAISLGLIAIFELLGESITLSVANGNLVLADMANTYIAILVWFSPLMFILSINSDALRIEGRVGFMAAVSLLVSIANIGFDYFLIGILDMGVAGSAYGTALAQFFALAIVLGFRLTGQTPFKLAQFDWSNLTHRWARFLALGAPQSLMFVGLSLGSSAIILMIQVVGVRDYEATIAAFGVINRVMSFTFLVLLGMSHALQAIVGNNYGASLWQRSDGVLRLAVVVAFVYAGVAQAILIGFRHSWGPMFVDDPRVAAEVARILPVMAAAYAVVGPQMMISTYFQAIGDAGRAALLSLSRTYMFALPLTFLLPLIFGEAGIWWSGPIAEGCVIVLTAGVLAQTARRSQLRWGLFRTA